VRIGGASGRRRHGRGRLERGARDAQGALTKVDVFRKAQVAAGARTLAARWYLDADVFAEERERIFAASWIAVARTEAVAVPGAFVTVDVADESLILTRDATGVLHAFYNVCRHRGTQLCVEPAGRFANAIQCPYHAWTYALDGSLIAARAMAGVEGFERADYPLHEAAVAELDGFVFVNLAAHPEPFDSAFAPLAGRFAAWEIATLREARTIEYDLACNWKLIFQNYSECYHCPLVHPQLDALSPSDSGRNDLSEGPFLGGYSELRREAESVTLTGKTRRSPLGTVAGENLSRIYYYAVFPSLLLGLHPDYVMAHVVTPLEPARTRVRCSWYFAPDVVGASGFDPSDVVDFWDLTNRQDWSMNERTQIGVASRSYVPGPYANEEGLLGAFDRHYLAQMAPQQPTRATTSPATPLRSR
jgi:Rieske 2Fe-2S family protein